MRIHEMVESRKRRSENSIFRALSSTTLSYPPKNHVTGVLLNGTDVRSDRKINLLNSSKHRLTHTIALKLIISAPS